MKQIYIPPIVFYVFGAILVAFGILRAKYLGAPRPPRESVDEDEAPKETRGEPASFAGRAPSTDASPVRGPTERRHLRWGIIYILMGLFLVISTYLQTLRR
jgi:hypothetical protein